jgi:hypothetical protein
MNHLKRDKRDKKVFSHVDRCSMCGLHWYGKAVEGGALGGASPPVDNMV